MYLVLEASLAAIHGGATGGACRAECLHGARIDALSYFADTRAYFDDTTALELAYFLAPGAASS